ncbi:(2Fe-2S)-binding protein [Bhargavaea beijingensis]|uniref:(2Fe-2S)-binding protein n=1 Tax=Bhargavaea beijingensis TaxID=426756 RepID=A0A1G7A4D1_9BACL|nr:(2Fe-2S)-binding protein [Bhargavaea beijingensis]MCW1927284.1 (2Fe-2S)-binding protein [Bhargavaea beijingensis]RSK35587.1 (2Fe-2S)-binding protein [Bhargavaea beijingensis]SDE09630.1 sarcosine oxidase subunit alpha [Bhargavaea beijingensis]
MTERILDHPVLGALEPDQTVTFTFNGMTYEGRDGEPIAAALLAAGVRTLRHHEESGTPRGIYCNIGHCFECRVEVDGQQGVRACLTPVREGMVINGGGPLPAPVRDWRKNHA